MGDKCKMKKENITLNAIERLKKLIVQGTFDNIYDVAFVEGIKRIILFPTNDLILNENQFDTLVNSLIIGKEALYLMQLGENSDIFSQGNAVFKFAPPHLYREYFKCYEEENLYSICIMFSDSFEWVCVIDECLEGGVAILAGYPTVINEFELKYGNSKNDLNNYLDFLKEDEKRTKSNLQVELILKVLGEKAISQSNTANQNKAN